MFGSKVIARVTRNSPPALSSSSVHTLPLQGARLRPSCSRWSHYRQSRWTTQPSFSRWSHFGRVVQQASASSPVGRFRYDLHGYLK
ncbi:MAG: hypothetical protein LBV74_05985 [Tannerella sp.]|nr:hypothetical protein [Tannerella sp.]